MTCEQFREAVLRSPTQFTRAERAVIVRHDSQCAACKKYMDDTSDAILAQMSPVEALLAVLFCKLSTAQINAGDYADPEFREVVGLD